MIIGAQKSGTSALAAFLAQHPDIYMPAAKEVHAFDQPAFLESRDFALVDRRYEDRMTGYAGEPLVGEATPLYLFFPEIPALLHEYNPDLRLIVLLRDPVERAISHYAMEWGRGREARRAAFAFALEAMRLRRDPAPWHSRSALRTHSYLSRSRYSAQLERVRANFPREQVLLLTSRALWQDHAGTLARVYDFLGASPPSVLPARETVFASGGQQPVSRLTRWCLRAALGREYRRLRTRWGIDFG
jgi:hypothetical protein